MNKYNPMRLSVSRKYLLCLLLVFKSLKSAEATTGGFCKRKLFLEILENSQENTCARKSFLLKFLIRIFN